ncbi:MAG TPA: hypothetical protein VF587_05355 [Solirubrobacteraceae bacterium]
MNRRTLLLLTTLAATAATGATAADAGQWSPGAYQGKVSSISGGGSRGSASLAITRRKATLRRITMVLRCADGPKRTFTVRGAGSSHLRPGPVGASAMFRGKRTLDGHILEYDLVGGVKGSTFRATVDATASAVDDPSYPLCTLSGSLVARRR